MTTLKFVNIFKISNFALKFLSGSLPLGDNVNECMAFIKARDYREIYDKKSWEDLFWSKQIDATPNTEICLLIHRVKVHK